MYIVFGSFKAKPSAMKDIRDIVIEGLALFFLDEAVMG
jgi:hypothetical protein